MQRSNLILAILFCNISFCQPIELKGKFGASVIGGETIEFVGIDSFYFSGFYCTYGKQGKGKCEIVGNYLYLHFEKSKIKPKVDSTKKPLITREDNSGEKRSIKVICVDNNDVPIPYTSVRILKNNRMISGASAGEEGQASFRINDTEQPLVIETTSAGMKSQSLAIDKSSIYTIKIFLQENDFLNRDINNGEIYVYEIDELTEDLIMMRPANSGEKFRKYIRKKD